MRVLKACFEVEGAQRRRCIGVGDPCRDVQ
jgi:hypothetical protein